MKLLNNLIFSPKSTFLKLRIRLVHDGKGQIKTSLILMAINYLYSYFLNQGLSLKLGFKSNEANTIKTPKHKIQDEDFAVIFHGKIYSRDVESFLLDSIRQMRHFNPKIMIILSTYLSDLENLESFIEHEIELVDVPDVGQLREPYPKSICQQTFTVGLGLIKSNQAGKEFSIKIRVDQRVNASNLLKISKSYIETFPSFSESVSRIFTDSFDTNKFRPGVSDMFMVGRTKDLLEFWKPTKPEEHYLIVKDLCKKSTDEGWGSFRLPAVVLTARYLLKNLESIEYSGKAMYKAWHKYFGIIDAFTLDLKWFKSKDFLQSNINTFNWLDLNPNDRAGQIYSSEWITDFYSNIDPEGEIKTISGI
jgi:WavE lipopolysaccharide synthesis